MGAKKHKLLAFARAVLALGFVLLLARVHFGLLARSHLGFESLRGVIFPNSEQINSGHWQKVLERIRERSV